MTHEGLRTNALAAKAIASEPLLQSLSPDVRDAALALIEGMDELLALLDDGEDEA